MTVKPITRTEVSFTKEDINAISRVQQIIHVLINAGNEDVYYATPDGNGFYQDNLDDAKFVLTFLSSICEIR